MRAKWFSKIYSRLANMFSTVPNWTVSPMLSSRL